MKRSDIYLAISVVLFAIFCGGLCEYALKIGIPKCPQITATVTPAQHDVDSTPNLPLIVTHAKPHIRPVKDTITALMTADTTPPIGINPTQPQAGILPNLDATALAITYNTYKTFKNGDSIAISATSKILPIIPPSDWFWYVDRFTRPDTTSITVTEQKQRHFGIGPYAGYGYSERGFTASVGIALSWHVFVF